VFATGAITSISAIALTMLKTIKVLSVLYFQANIGTVQHENLRERIERPFPLKEVPEFKRRFSFSFKSPY
jgi:hypothetical protein